MNFIFNIYRYLFVRKLFFKMHVLLYRLSLRGLGVLNHESDKVSGEAVFLKKYFQQRQGGIVIDVGANIGEYSKAVVDANPLATVYAFEPHPKTFKRLLENVTSKNFHPFNVAVGDNAGVLLLYDYEENNGSPHASLYRDVIENIHNSKAIEHKVKVINLGEFLAEKSIEKVALLKIDTEGNEFNVLKGVERYIDEGKINAIHFEFNEMNVSSRTYFRDFFNLLHNYDIYRLLPNGMVKIKAYSPILCEIFAYQNIVAIRKG